MVAFELCLKQINAELSSTGTLQRNEQLDAYVFSVLVYDENHRMEYDYMVDWP